MDKADMVDAINDIRRCVTQIEDVLYKGDSELQRKSANFNAERIQAIAKKMQTFFEL